MPNPLLAVRVHPWQAFKIRRYAQYRKMLLGLVLMEALQIYFSSKTEKELPPELIEGWLKEYHQIHREG